MEGNNILDHYRFDDVDDALKQDIDYSIEKILAESKNNEEDIAQLVLECSGALGSAKERESVLSNQSFFRKIWGKVTGKNEKLKLAIERDQNVAQYAMQKVISSVLDECRHNRELSVCIHDKLERQIDALNTDQVKLSEGLSQTRRCLVEVADEFNTCISQLNDRVERQQSCMAQRCEKCRESIPEERVICPYCGTIQTMKLENIPEEYKKLSQIMGEELDDSVADITWDTKTVQKLANRIAKAKKILKINKEHGDPKLTTVKKDIDAFLAECRDARVQIAVVGIMKAGKSMLMNALIGMNLAPVAINPTTAAITRFHASSEGNFVKVQFYTDQEWEELWSSVQAAGSGSNDYQKKLQDPLVEEERKKWINHKSIISPCDNLKSFQEEIFKWVAADSLQHLFVSEVEVGIEKSCFNMPEEVEFVDTPGLDDPVEYRSQITKGYLENADSAIIAASIKHFTGSELKTIITTLEHMGEAKKDKVFIVGTQKDRLNSINECNKIVFGQRMNESEISAPEKVSWVRCLAGTTGYKNTREVENQIITTSAYIHIWMKKILSYSNEQINDSNIIGDDDYNNFRNFILKALNKREYTISNFKCEVGAQNIVSGVTGIETLINRIKVEIVNNYREIKIARICRHYQMCIKTIFEYIEKQQNSYENMMDISTKPYEEMKKKLEDKKKQLENEKERLSALSIRVEHLRDNIKEKFEQMWEEEA